MASDTPGLDQINALRDGNFSQDEITAYKASRSQALQEGGFSQDDIDKYWGDYKPPSPELTKGVQDNLRTGNALPEHEPGNPAPQEKFDYTSSKDWIEQLGKGWGGSASGYDVEDRMSDPATTPFAAHLLQLAGREAGDLPYQLIGGGLGAVAGSPAGPPGVLAGAGGGMAALPAWVREHYVDGMTKGQYKDFGDFVSRHAVITLHATMAGVPGAILGPAVGPVAGKIGGAVADAVGPVAGKLAQGAAIYTGWGVGGAAINSAMQMRAPTVQEVEDSVLVMGAMGLITHGAIKLTEAGKPYLSAAGRKIASSMTDVYKDTGITPKEMPRLTNDVPAARINLASKTWDGETPTDKFLQYAPKMPQPAPKGEPAIGVENGLGNSGMEAVQPKDQGPLAEAQQKMEETKPVSVPTNAATSRETGIPSKVENVSPQRLMGAIKNERMFDEALQMSVKVKDPDQAEKYSLQRLRELLPKFKNADGTVDLEGALAAYHAGFAKASMFRDAGRDYDKLPMETRRFLERVGDFLGNEQGAFKYGAKSPTPEQIAAQKLIDDKVAEAKKITDQQKRSRAMPTEALRQQFSKELPDKPKLDFWDMYRKARYKWSKFYPAQQFDKMFNAKGEEGVGLDGQMRLQIASGGKFVNRMYAGGIMPKKDSVGNTYYDLDKSVPSLHSIYEEAKGREGGMEAFDEIQRAAHTIDMAKLTNDTKGNLYDAAELMRREGGKWKDLLAKSRLVRDSMIDRLIDTGMISREQASEWRVDHPNWHSEGDDALADEIGKLHDWEYAAQINKARKFAAEVLDRNGYLGEIKEGKDAEEKTFDYSNPPAYKPLIFNPKQIEWLDDGVKKSAEIADNMPGKKYFVDMLMNDNYVKETGLEKLLGTFARIDRAWALADPRTLMRIMYKDGVQAMISHKDGGIMVKNTVHGMFDALDNLVGGRVSKDGNALSRWARYEANGGYSMAINAMDENEVIRAVRKEKYKWFGPLANLQKGGQLIHGLIRSTDAMTRVGGPFRNLEPKVGTVGAAIESRLIHGDFAEPVTSRSLKIISKALPFTISHIRGDVDAVARAIARDPVGVAMRGFTWALLVSAITYGHNDQFERDHPDMPESMKMKNLPDYQRYLFSHYHMNIGGSYHDFPLPVPWGMGEIFHGAVQSFFDWWRGDDPHSFSHYVDALLKEFELDDPLTHTPIIKPVIETWANKNLDYGGPIVNYGEASRSKYMQYDNNTSETAKALSYYIGPQGLNVADWSPKYTDRFIEDWLGGSGLKALKVLEAPIKEYQMNPKDWTKATMEQALGDVWLGSSFLRLQTSTQPITDLYDVYGKAEAVHSDYKHADKIGDDAAKAEIMARPEWQINATELRKTIKFLAGQRHVAEAIEKNTNMTTNEKHAALDNIANMMVVTSRNALEQYVPKQ